MNSIQLKLNYRPTPVRPAAAAFLPGADVAAWLREIASWDVPADQIRLFPIPTARADRTPRGVLVAAGDRWPHGGRAGVVPFGRVGRLYLPVNGQLDPEVSPAELNELLSPNKTYVWHPRTGLVGFEESDSLFPSQLLDVEPAVPFCWDTAQLPVTLAPRLTAVLPERELRPGEVMDRGRDNIGRQKDRLNKLKPVPGEPRKGVLRWSWRQARGMVARAAQRFAAAVPATSPHETWVNRLEQWANQVVAELGQHGDRQLRLIRRLLRLLESDPEQGLEYAIPVNEPEAFRGIAPSPERLERHGTDFNLRRLKGGGRVAYWDVAAELRQQLINRYRAVANRELRLKRHRRAAYIFAHLLHDYDSAARALAAGGHFREAAALYRDELQRPLDAAHCLEQGAHWSEAIALYEECRAYERAGDVWRKLGDLRQARREYRRALADLRESRDHLAAAALLVEKLEDVPAAIEELRWPWPVSVQAVACLRELLGLLGREGRHGEAVEMLVQVRDGDLPQFNRTGLPEVLATIATTYPDRRVRELAADSARVVVARQLDGATRENARRLTQSLRRLDTDDLLLGRDCRRYVERIVKEVRTSPIVASGKKTMRKVREVRLRGGAAVDWVAAAWGGKTIFAAGYRDNTLWLVRCNRWVDGRFRAHWKLPHAGKRAPVLLSVHPVDGRIVLINTVGDGLPHEERWLHEEDKLPVASKVLVSSLSPAVAIDVSTSGAVWSVRRSGVGWELVGCSATGEPLSSWSLPDFECDLQRDALPQLHVRQDRFYLAATNEVMVVEGGQKVLALELEQPIRSLVGSFPNTRVRLLAACETGVALVWDNRYRLDFQTLGEGLTKPMASFVRGGYVVMADHHRCQLYQVTGQNVALAAQAEHDAGEIIGIVPAVHSAGWSLISRRGTVHVYDSEPT